jgi:hypothetical protein
MEIEEAFAITIPEQAPNPVYKSVLYGPEMKSAPAEGGWPHIPCGTAAPAVRKLLF